jgi:hypothetical protein
LRRHRHNKKSPLVHTQDAIHDRLANLELGRVHQSHPFMARGVKGRRYNLTGRGPNSSGRPETCAGSGLPGSAHLRALDHIPSAACRSLRNFAASAPASYKPSLQLGSQFWRLLAHFITCSVIARQFKNPMTERSFRNFSSKICGALKQARRIRRGPRVIGTHTITRSPKWSGLPLNRAGVSTVGTVMAIGMRHSPPPA